MTYRHAPTSPPLARVEGRDLHVLDGTRLPRMCMGCGNTRRLREEEHLVEWRPAGALFLLSLGWIGRLLAGTLQRTARLTYSTCKGCRSRTRNADDLFKLLIVGMVVVLLAAATVGLNGYPVQGVIIAVVGLVAAGLGGYAIARGRGSMRVTYIHSNGTVTMRGVHVKLARAAVENTRDAAGHELGNGETADE